jgi:ABC-type multidrug transport system permease subunit
VLVELPYVALQTLLYSGITYLLVGFELAAAKFFWYLLFTFLTLLFFTYYGESLESLEAFRGDASAGDYRDSSIF